MHTAKDANPIHETVRTMLMSMAFILIIIIRAHNIIVDSQLLNHYFASVGFAASAEHRDILSPTDSHLGGHTATL